MPLAGWDVALTKEAGMCLLEVNLSCNFFRGTFDQREYFKFCNEYFAFLDKASRRQTSWMEDKDPPHKNDQDRRVG